jgi:hypothetical protein
MQEVMDFHVFRPLDMDGTDGKAGTAFLRDPSRAEYPDGKAAPIATGRPSARKVSNDIFTRKEGPPARVTTLFTYFAQFVFEDIAKAQTKSDRACGLGYEPLPIDIPEDDIFYAHGESEGRIISFNRTTHCVANSGERVQINGATAFVDASNIYGSTPQEANMRRSHSGGTLIDTFPYPFRSEDQCLGKDCLLQGDLTGSTGGVLGALRALFVREHNRIAWNLLPLHPDWDDERVFQESRRLLIAKYQAIVYEEFLPVLLGQSCPALNATVTPNTSSQSAKVREQDREREGVCVCVCVWSLHVSIGMCSQPLRNKQVTIEFATLAAFINSALPTSVLLVNPDDELSGTTDIPLTESLLSYRAVCAHGACLHSHGSPIHETSTSHSSTRQQPPGPSLALPISPAGSLSRQCPRT